MPRTLNPETENPKPYNPPSHNTKAPQPEGGPPARAEVAQGLDQSSFFVVEGLFPSAKS